LFQAHAKRNGKIQRVQAAYGAERGSTPKRGGAIPDCPLVHLLEGGKAGFDPKVGSLVERDRARFRRGGFIEERGIIFVRRRGVSKGKMIIRKGIKAF